MVSLGDKVSGVFQFDWLVVANSPASRAWTITGVGVSQVAGKVAR
jgi:hypothetical protein